MYMLTVVFLAAATGREQNTLVLLLTQTVVGVLVEVLAAKPGRAKTRNFLAEIAKTWYNYANENGCGGEDYAI